MEYYPLSLEIWVRFKKMQGGRGLMRGLAILCCAAFFGCGGERATTTGLKHVPRNRTLITDCAENNTCGGQIQDYEAFNPFVPGGVCGLPACQTWYSLSVL